MYNVIKGGFDMTVGEYIKNLRTKQSISQRELSKISGISNAEISRIETGERQKPSPDVLRKLAPYLEVPYESLMDKAGYINERSIFMAENKEAEDKFISIVAPKLIMDGWGIEPMRGSLSLGDIVAKKKDQEWHIDFKYFKTRDDDDKNFRYNNRARQATQQSYGRLVTYDKTPITKFTIAVNDEKIFDILIETPPVHLNMQVSIMLIDLDESEVVQEYEF